MSAEFDRSRSTTSTITAPVRTEVEIIALGAGDDFLVELGDLLHGQATVHPLERLPEALTALTVGARGKVLVIDTRGYAPVSLALERTAVEAPHAAVVVLGDVPTQTGELNSAHGRSPAVLRIPFDPSEAAPVLAGAIACARAPDRGINPKSSPLGASIKRSPVTQASKEDPYHAALQTERKMGGAWSMALVVLVFVGVLAGLSLLYTRALPEVPSASGDVLPAPPKEALPEVNLARGTVDEFLEKARQAMRRRHYVQPKEDSALHYYRLAQAADPSNPEVQDGLARVAAALLAHAQAEAGQGHWESCRELLTELTLLLPQDPQVIALSRRVAEHALGANSAASAQEAAVQSPVQSAPQASVAGLQRRSPPDPPGPAADRLHDGVASGQVRHARAAPRPRELAIERPPAPTPLSTQGLPAPVSAGSVGDSTPTLTPPPPPAVLGRPGASEGQPAPVATAASGLAPPRKIHEVMPVFPPLALQKGLNGTVTVQFVIDAKGEPGDVHVVDASPPRVFDHAAVSAVRRWRYESSGAPQEVTVVVQFPKPQP